MTKSAIAKAPATPKSSQQSIKSNVNIKQDTAESKSRIPNGKNTILHENVADWSHLHPHRNLADQAIQAVQKAKKIVIITGAGVSVDGGIPDFRSMNGLYNLVKRRFPDAVVRGKDIFDANLFKDEQSVKVFYSFMAELKGMVDAATVTPSHEFVKNIKDRQKLLRCYTQNIDGLESQLGLNCDMNSKSADVVMLHGAISHVVCTICKFRVEFTDAFRDQFAMGEPKACNRCTKQSDQRLANNRRALPIGFMRPDIILYNEHHQACDTIGACWDADLKKRPDLVIVMGTTLKVAGIKTLVKDFIKQAKQLDEHQFGQFSVSNKQSRQLNPSKPVRTILVNKNDIGAEWRDMFDVTWLGEASDICSYIWRGVQDKDRLAEQKKQTRFRRPSAASSTMFQIGSNVFSQPEITKSFGNFILDSAKKPAALNRKKIAAVKSQKENVNNKKLTVALTPISAPIKKVATKVAQKMPLSPMSVALSQPLSASPKKSKVLRSKKEIAVAVA